MPDQPASDRPEQVRPESVRPESVRPESVRPESVRPESVRPESVRPESVRPEPQEITDVEALRLLAHPMRQRIERQLRNGPANSTTLARALGQSSGVTSYHLRQMAKHGFIEEVPELAKGRERWWRHVPADRRIPPYSRQTPEMRAEVEKMNRLDLADELEQLTRFQLERDDLGEWADALAWSRSTIRLTPEELEEFLEAYVKLLYRYKRPDEATPPRARAVHARLLAFPAPSDDD